MIRAIIIDDEEMAREIIRDYLDKFEDIEVIEECSDGFSGLRSIQEHKPDLIFLDVQMPKLTGFELLEVLEEKPAILFTTAYDQYAIQAFEKNAVDYLLKPFTETRFASAVQKAIDRINRSDGNTGENKLKEEIENKDELINRIVVRTTKEIRILPVEKLYYIEAQDDYVMIHTESEKFLKQKTMKYYETHLDPVEFVRVHRSFIVKIDRISRIESWEKNSYLMILKDGRKLPVSRSGYSKLKLILDL